MLGLGFEQLLMQTASTGNASIDSAIAVIVAVAAIAGVVAPFLKLYAKTKTLGQYVDTFSQKTTENEEAMKRLAMAARGAVPELDDKLKEYEVPLADLERRVEAAKEQIEYFRDKIPTSSQASSITELPREKSKINLKLKKRH